MVKHFPYMMAAIGWLNQNGFAQIDTFFFIGSNPRRSASIHVVAGTTYVAVLISDEDWVMGDKTQVISKATWIVLMQAKARDWYAVARWRTKLAIMNTNTLPGVQEEIEADARVAQGHAAMYAKEVSRAMGLD